MPSYPWLAVLLIFAALCAAAGLVLVRARGGHAAGRWRLFAASLVADVALLGLVAGISVWRFDPLWQVIVSTLYLVVQTVFFRHRLGRLLRPAESV